MNHADLPVESEINTSQADIDHGRKMATFTGHKIRFVDSQAQFDDVSRDVQTAGYDDAGVVAVKGEDGVVMHALLQVSFRVADGEDAIIEFSL